MWNKLLLITLVWDKVVGFIKAFKDRAIQLVKDMVSWWKNSSPNDY